MELHINFTACHKICDVEAREKEKHVSVTFAKTESAVYFIQCLGRPLDFLENHVSYYTYDVI